jgi:hypothetical protein
VSEAENLSDDSAADDTTEGTETTETKTAATVVTTDDDKPVAHPADWPEDWRAKLAGEDEKALARLTRFKSPADIFKSYINAEKKIAQGLKPAPLKEGASDEEVAAWRAANDVPEAPDKYDTNLGDGQVLGEEDKPLVDSFLQYAHKANMPQPFAKAALGWYYQFQDEQKQAQFEQDEAERIENTDVLRSEWGAEMRPNLNAIRGWLDTVDGTLFDRLFSARDAEGRSLGNNTALIKAMVEAAKAINPAATLMPGSVNTSGKGIDDRIAEIESIMRGPDSREKYWKSESVQAEYRKLLEARDKLKSR